MGLKSWYCQKCGCLLGKAKPQNKRLYCRSCANSGKLNPNYKNGSHLRSKKICPLCGCKMDSRSKKCMKCRIKELENKKPANFKNITTRHYFCSDCNKEISVGSGYYGGGRCSSCSSMKNGLPKCIDCGKLLNRYNNIRCKKCNNKYLTGKNHPAYIPNIKRKYPFIFSNKLKLKIRKRDKYTCQICGKASNIVHHIDYNKYNCKENNLITLCRKCHAKTNFNRIAWLNYFKNKSYLLYSSPKIIYTAGTFDILNVGHLNIFEQSKKLGDKLIVGVSTDELVETYKKIKPIMPYKDRTEIIKSLKYVDEVVRQEVLIDTKILKKHKVNCVTIGSDWKDKYLPGLEWMKRNGEVVYLPYTERVSSTIIKTRIIENSFNIIKAMFQREN